MSRVPRSTCRMPRAFVRWAIARARPSSSTDEAFGTEAESFPVCRPNSLSRGILSRVRESSAAAALLWLHRVHATRTPRSAATRSGTSSGVRGNAEALIREGIGPGCAIYREQPRFQRGQSWRGLRRFEFAYFTQSATEENGPSVYPHRPLIFLIVPCQALGRAMWTAARCTTASA